MATKPPTSNFLSEHFLCTPNFFLWLIYSSPHGDATSWRRCHVLFKASPNLEGWITMWIHVISHIIATLEKIAWKCCQILQIIQIMVLYITGWFECKCTWMRLKISCMHWNIISGWWFEPPWKIWKSIGMIIPNIWENRKIQTTNQSFIRSPQSGPRCNPLTALSWEQALPRDLGTFSP